MKNVIARGWSWEALESAKEAWSSTDVFGGFGGLGGADVASAPDPVRQYGGLVPDRPDVAEAEDGLLFRDNPGCLKKYVRRRSTEAMHVDCRLLST